METMGPGDEGGDGPARLLYRRRQRLTHAREYQAVYAAKARKVRGPLVVFGRPNGLDVSRLGLSVGRGVGGAVARNRVKRMIREAFRLEQAVRGRVSGAGECGDECVGGGGGVGGGVGGVPAGYDLVVTVRAHRPLRLAAYRAMLVEAAREVAKEWGRRERREARGEGGVDDGA